MKKKVRLSMIVFLGMFLLLAGTIFQAQATIHYSNIIDEYGLGYYRDNTSQDTSWHVWSGALRTDWTLPVDSNGKHTQSLIYIGSVNPTPFSGYNDVLVLEYGSPSPDVDPANIVVSDVIRFWVNPNPSGADNLPNHNWIIFYSDISDGPEPLSLADINGMPDTVNVVQWVWENQDGFFYFRTGGDTQGNFNAEFSGYSEGHATVPEPATMLLLCTGLFGLVGLRRKFKK